MTEHINFISLDLFNPEVRYILEKPQNLLRCIRIDCFMTGFEYYCYRCGGHNALDFEIPKAPGYLHQELKCSSCDDNTRVLLSACPGEDCGRYVYWINDLSIPDLVVGFARYMVHNMQAMIDKAAQQGTELSIDTPDKYPINAACPCGTEFAVEINIPDLD